MRFNFRALVRELHRCSNACWSSWVFVTLISSIVSDRDVPKKAMLGRVEPERFMFVIEEDRNNARTISQEMFPVHEMRLHTIKELVRMSVVRDSIAFFERCIWEIKNLFERGRDSIWAQRESERVT